MEIATAGDQQTDTPLADLGSTGVFTNAIQRALIAGEVDLAVHSLKDLPTATLPGLTLAAIPLRAAPFDVLVSREPTTLAGLPTAARVGTSSVRRRARLTASCLAIVS